VGWSIFASQEVTTAPQADASGAVPSWSAWHPIADAPCRVFATSTQGPTWCGTTPARANG